MALDKLWTRLYSTLCKVGRIGSQGLLTWSATWHFFYIKTLTYTANAYRQTTDKLIFKSVISTIR